MNRGPLSPLSPQLAGFSGTRDRAVPVWACFAILMPASNHRSPVRRRQTAARPACVRPMRKQANHKPVAGRLEQPKERPHRSCKVAIAECHQPPNARHHGQMGRHLKDRISTRRFAAPPAAEGHAAQEAVGRSERAPPLPPSAGHRLKSQIGSRSPPCLARRQESDCSQAACMPNIPHLDVLDKVHVKRVSLGRV